VGEGRVGGYAKEGAGVAECNEAGAKKMTKQVHFARRMVLVITIVSHSD
jgi:hypothetical protein